VPSSQGYFALFGVKKSDIEKIENQNSGPNRKMMRARRWFWKVLFYQKSPQFWKS